MTIILTILIACLLWKAYERHKRVEWEDVSEDARRQTWRIDP